jgi:hypothetical protein
MSFEFAGGGAGDVKLRLSERAGEVHVSLHSSDATVNNQLREGLHDLTTLLNNAGYDTEARGGQREEREQPQTAPSRKSASGAFDSMLDEIPQEVL